MKDLLKYVLILLVSAGVYCIYGWHIDEVEKAREEIISEYSKQDAKEFERQLQASQELFEATLEDYKQYADKINNDNSRLQLLNNSLRDRITRAEKSQGDIPTSPCEGAGTGAGLYREDAEFLAGEASRANRVLSERDYYYTAYKRAEEKLKEFNGKD